MYGHLRYMNMLRNLINKIKTLILSHLLLELYNELCFMLSRVSSNKTEISLMKALMILLAVLLN